MPCTSFRTRAPRVRALAVTVALMSWVCATLAIAQPRAPARRPRDVPETLNFANGLFRERRFALAAEEYERFLEDARPGPFADEARFGLASARLFLGEYEKARKQFEIFLKNSPDHVNASAAWYRMGETAYVLGDLPAARRALETYTSRFPKHRYNDTAWPYLGDVCYRLGDLPKARQAYERALADFPTGRLANRARLGLGRTLAAQGETDAARKVLAALAQHGGPDWADKAWYQIGQVEAASGRWEQAVEAFARLARDTPNSPLVTESKLRRAEALIKLDRLDDAQELLRDLVGDSSQTIAAQAAFLLGSAQYQQGHAAEAFTTLDNALRRFPNAPATPALLFRSAEAKLKLGDPAEARARFLKVVESAPSDPWADDALLQAARLALEAKDHDAARQLAASFSEKFPKSPLRADIRLIDAQAALAAGRPKEAIAVLTAALEDEPEAKTASSLRYTLGQAYQMDGQTAKAKETFGALADAPAAPVATNAQFLLGQEHIKAKQFAEAIPPLEKYLAANPDGDVADYALGHLAQAQLEVGHTEDAWKALAQLAERFPKSPVLARTRVLLAESALGAKQYDRAAEQFRLAAEGSDPALRVKAQSGLGWTFLEAGKPEDAASVFAALLQAAPDDPIAPDAALALGRALERSKQTERALTAYEAVSQKYPKSTEARAATIARARLLVDAKRPAEAAEVFEQCVKDFADSPENARGETLDALLSEWGWALIDADKTADADRVFTRLLNEFPDSPHAFDARFNLAESAHKDGKNDEVVTLLTPLVAEGSKAPRTLREPALYRLGRTEAERKNWPEAAKTLDRFLAEFPQSRYHREARFLRAEVALRADDPKSAEERFARLESEPAAPGDPPGFSAAIRRLRIQSLLALKRWKDVIDAADALKKDAPDDPLIVEADYARGRALQSLAKFDEARAAYQAVIDARKGGELAARAQLMRGETYFHQKSFREALLEYHKVDILYEAPRWQAAALLEAGKVYEQLAQWDDAAETYERLRSKFPDDPAAVEAKTRLEAVRKQKSASSPAPNGRDE